LRVREFVMKDAYSFDADQAGLEKSYKAQHGAYERIFKRMGLDAISVESDTGAMGGDVAHEFQVLTEAVDDRIVICLRCAYKANEAQVREVLDVGGIKFAGDADFAKVGGVAGFVGPVGLRARIVVDRSVDARPYVAGANKKDAHLDRVVLGRDFDGERVDVHD